MKKFLIIQTAFIGDAILASPVIEKLQHFYPNAQLSLLLRKGNEGLFRNHPYLHEVISWDKKSKKYRHLVHVIRKCRKVKYDHIINLQRFATTGMLTCLLRGNEKIGFTKNPFSFCYHKKGCHEIKKGVHEIDRNLTLIEHLTAPERFMPRLYPDEEATSTVSQLKRKPYICIAPTSVWFTKQTPQEKWIELINRLSPDYTVYLLGGKNDVGACQELVEKCDHSNIINLAGKLDLLASAALMKDARMNYVNDSAPLHLASAMNAPVTAVFCSTVTDFGFGPLSDRSRTVEINGPLYCRPCGLHGFKACPEGHFKCGNLIDVNDFFWYEDYEYRN